MYVLSNNKEYLVYLTGGIFDPLGQPALPRTVDRHIIGSGPLRGTTHLDFSPSAP